MLLAPAGFAPRRSPSCCAPLHHCGPPGNARAKRCKVFVRADVLATGTGRLVVRRGEHRGARAYIHASTGPQHRCGANCACSRQPARVEFLSQRRPAVETAATSLGRIMTTTINLLLRCGYYSTALSMHRARRRRRPSPPPTARRAIIQSSPTWPSLALSRLYQTPGQRHSPESWLHSVGHASITSARSRGTSHSSTLKDKGIRARNAPPPREGSRRTQRARA